MPPCEDYLAPRLPLWICKDSQAPLSDTIVFQNTDPTGNPRYFNCTSCPHRTGSNPGRYTGDTRDLCRTPGACCGYSGGCAHYLNGHANGFRPTFLPFGPGGCDGQGGSWLGDFASCVGANCSGACCRPNCVGCVNNLTPKQCRDTYGANAFSRVNKTCSQLNNCRGACCTCCGCRQDLCDDAACEAKGGYRFHQQVGCAGEGCSPGTMCYPLEYTTADPCPYPCPGNGRCRVVECERGGGLCAGAEFAPVRRTSPPEAMPDRPGTYDIASVAGQRMMARADQECRQYYGAIAVDKRFDFRPKASGVVCSKCDTDAKRNYCPVVRRTDGRYSFRCGYRQPCEQN